MTNYPAQIDTSISLPSATDNFTPVTGNVVNRLRNAILAIETELGVQPSGVYSNVAGRLDVIESTLGNLQIISLAGDLGGSLANPQVIGIHGRPISSAVPNLGDVLTWNGIAWEPNPNDTGPNPIYLAQTQWHIDPINGNNNNSGNSSTTPIKTFAEYIRRCGMDRYLSFNLTFYIYNDLPETDPILSTFNTSSTGTVNVLAANLTVLRSGTIGTYRTFNRSTKTPPGFTDNSGSINWAPYIGKLVKITSGVYANKDAYFWIAKDEGGGTARISFPKYRDPANTFAELSFVPQAGDTYQILELRKASIQITVDGAANNNRITGSVERFAPIGGTLTGNSGYTINQSANIDYWWCDFAFLAADANQTDCHMCRFSGIIGTLGTFLASSCLFQTIDLQVKGTLFLGDAFIQGSSRPRFHYPGESGIYCDSPTGDFAIFDCGNWLFVDQGAIIQLKANVWGAGNTGPLVQVHTGTFYDKMTSFNYSSTTNNNGAYGTGTYDFIINNKTTALAIDPGTLQRIYPARDLTFTNLRAAVSAGGFGGSATDPYTLMGIVSGNSASTYANATSLAQQQSQWYIDPINGNDNNDGYTALTALKTAAEQHRRVGPVHDYTNVTVTIMSSLLPSDTLYLSKLVLKSGTSIAPNAGFPGYRVIGIPKLVASGTITGVRTWDQTTNTEWGIQTSLGDMSTHARLGRIIVRTSGSTTFPDKFWIAKNEDGYFMTRISFPGHFSTNEEVNVSFMTSPLIVGDTFDIYDLPTIPSVCLDAISPTWGLVCQNLRFIGLPANYAAAVFKECSFDNFVNYATTQTHFSNCQFGGIMTLAPGSSWYCQMGLALNALKLWQGAPSFQNYFMFQGGSTLTGNGNSNMHCHTRGFSVWDQVTISGGQRGDGLVIQAGDTLTFAGTLMGGGNDGYGVNCAPGGLIIVGGLGPSGAGFFLAQGALGEITVGGRASGPAINTTNPYGYTEDRLYSYANFNASVAAGGFGQKIIDPLRPGSGIIPDY